MPLPKALTFGDYHLIPKQRLLLRGNAPAPIGSRALDILIVLVQHAGELVSKEKLIASVWPETHVHEANLRVHIGGIRKLLSDGQAGAHYIVSEAGRGYRFVAPVVVAEAATAPAGGGSPVAEAMPASFAPIIGRDDVVGALVDNLPRRRFVTLVGPGGVGKTTVARAVAERIGRNLPTTFVDLGPLADPALVGGKIAAALGVVSRSDGPLASLAAVLRDKSLLLVLDTCEHMIDALTPLLEGVGAGAPHVQILATSRERLRARGEWVQRIAPLDVPGEATPSAAQALAYPAVQLFVERAGANLDGFRLTDANAPLVADICRRLDGLPLAIEIAASRIQAFGLKGLRDLLDRRFRLPALERRMAPARHRTLAAMIDWSYQSLPEPEGAALRRLAIFAGPFTLEAAGRVARDARLAEPDVVECVANLVESSLIAADLTGEQPLYRLLDTTRAYALEKLNESNERDATARRHAEFLRDLFEGTAGERERDPLAWVARYRREIDNLRAALDWAFSRDGDAGLGVRLVLAAIPLWIHLSMNEECCARVEAALARLDPHDPDAAHARMQLSTALGGAVIYAKGVVPDLAAWSDTLETAQALGDVEFQLRALWGMWTERMQQGAFRPALDRCREFIALAKTSPVLSDVFVGERMLGLSLHFLGEQEEARRLIEHMLAHYVPDPKHITRFQLDQRLIGRGYLSMVLWLLGLPDQGRGLVELNLREAEDNHGISVTYAAAQSACAIAANTGDLACLDRALGVLHERSALHGAFTFDRWARCYEAVRLIEFGDARAGADSLERELSERPTTSLRLPWVGLLCALADAFGRLGEIDRADAALAKAADRAERDDERWCQPELLRVKGEILRHKGDDAAAEACWRDSLDLARMQKTLSWELRTATSLAALWAKTKPREARSVLSSVYAKFTEGFETRDLRRAADLLALLQ